MPYTRGMVRFAKQVAGKSDGPIEAPQSSRTLRVTPSHIDSDPKAGHSKFVSNQAQGCFVEKVLKHMRVLLNVQVGRLQRIDGSISTSNRAFKDYEWDQSSEPIKLDPKCKMYKAKNKDYPDTQLVVKVFDNITASVDNSMYLKIVRHINKDFSDVVQTWDVFHDEQRHIFLFQEYVDGPDLAVYIKDMKEQSESQVQQWARQLFRAMNYLADIVVCHRAIKPSNVLLNPTDLSIRLTGFYDSCVYWIPETEDIRYIPCLPLASKSRSLPPDFQAPEVYGNPEKEEFDPIMADVWSCAAVVYFAATRGNYPYNIQLDNPKVEDEIRTNVYFKVALCEEAKHFLAALLHPNALNRMAFFQQIGKQTWLLTQPCKDDNIAATKSNADDSTDSGCGSLMIWPFTIL